MNNVKENQSPINWMITKPQIQNKVGLAFFFDSCIRCKILLNKN